MRLSALMSPGLLTRFGQAWRACCLWPGKSSALAYLIAAGLYAITASLLLAVEVNLLAAVERLAYALYLFKTKKRYHILCVCFLLFTTSLCDTASQLQHALSALCAL